MEVRGRADPSAGRAGVLAVDSQIPELWRTRFCRSRAVQSAASCRGSRNRLTIGVGGIPSLSRRGVRAPCRRNVTWAERHRQDVFALERSADPLSNASRQR